MKNLPRALIALCLFALPAARADTVVSEDGGDLTLADNAGVLHHYWWVSGWRKDHRPGAAVRVAAGRDGYYDVEGPEGTVARYARKD